MLECRVVRRRHPEDVGCMDRTELSPQRGLPDAERGEVRPGDWRAGWQPEGRPWEGVGGSAGGGQRQNGSLRRSWARSNMAEGVVENEGFVAREKLDQRQLVAWRLPESLSRNGLNIGKGTVHHLTEWPFWEADG